jgi:hypothetical protein
MDEDGIRVGHEKEQCEHEILSGIASVFTSVLLFHVASNGGINPPHHPTHRLTTDHQENEKVVSASQPIMDGA